MQVPSVPYMYVLIECLSFEEEAWAANGLLSGIIGCHAAILVGVELLLQWTWALYS